jgi:hypothetical protein
MKPCVRCGNANGLYIGGDKYDTDEVIVYFVHCPVCDNRGERTTAGIKAAVELWNNKYDEWCSQYTV